MEVVIAAAITAVIFVAVSTAVGGGLMAWRKAEELAHLTRESQQMTRALEGQLTRAIASKTFPFEGTQSSLRFVMTDGAGTPMQVSWRAALGLAGQPGAITNSTQVLPPLSESATDPERIQRFPGISDVEFSFPMQIESETGAPYEWRHDWATDENVVHVPQAVRIAVTLQGPRGGRIHTERLAVLPQGLFGKVEEPAPS